jgi:hypothetical protein
MNILNDTEHRLFLSAMQREKKICEQFDNSGDSGIKLLPICRSIERKVDKAIEQRKGHWVTKPNVFGVAYCSECDFELRIDNTNFCPNCGADMREV